MCLFSQCSSNGFSEKKLSVASLISVTFVWLQKHFSHCSSFVVLCNGGTYVA